MVRPWRTRWRWPRKRKWTEPKSSCLICRAQYPLAEVRKRQALDAAEIPRCDCGQPLKPDVVLFGELLPEAAIGRAQELAAGADLLLCVGSSLEVYPVAGASV